MTDATLAEGPTRPQSTLRRLLRRKLAILGMGIIAMVTLGAIFAPWIAPFAPQEQMFDGLTLEGAPMPPGEKFWLGTDQYGRDILSRLLHGARATVVLARNSGSAPTFWGATCSRASFMARGPR